MLKMTICLFYIYYYLIFTIHFLSTSQFKLKLFKSECRYSYAKVSAEAFRHLRLGKSFRAVR